MKLGNMIKKLRLEREMSQEELSFLLDVCKDDIVLYENGKRIPTLKSLMVLVEIFGISLLDLVPEVEEHTNYFYL